MSFRLTRLVRIRPVRVSTPPRGETPPVLEALASGDGDIAARRAARRGLRNLSAVSGKLVNFRVTE